MCLLNFNALSIIILQFHGINALQETHQDKLLKLTGKALIEI